MNKVKVLFFAADPLSIPPDGSKPRLLLDEEVRRIRRRVEAAVFGNMLEFDWRLAARAHDVLQALEETRPQIVHFSGHGGSRGLVLAGADGRTPRHVDAGVLRELFARDPGDIRLVVLTACHSLAHADAVKEVVGCAIGANDRISDEASIDFNAKFYSAIASGRSVQDAFERARMALRIEHPEQAEILQLLNRKNVDPAKVVLVSRFRRFARLGAAVTAAVGVAGALIISTCQTTPPPPPGALRLGDCTTIGPASPPALSRSMIAASVEPASASEARASLDRAKAFCRAGNYDSAVVQFKVAAKEGDAEAMAFLAIAYLSGEGTSRDTVRAMALLDSAGKQMRHPRAMNALGVLYENDEHMDGRFRWAKHWYKASADSGYAEAMRNLGRFYEMGLGNTPVRADSALYWYQKAVEAGLMDAMVDIGRLHEQGIGIRRNPGEALRLYRAAADAGSAQGMNLLGRAYQEGIGIVRDYTQARNLYFKSACAGSADAMNNMGLLYQHGLGVEADRGEAIEWFKRGADKGSSAAATNLARVRRRGVGKVIALLDRPESAFPASCAA